MATKVFICWSGDLSRRLGEALRRWLPGVLQYVKPYFTPDDIEKGVKWDPDIARELEDSDIGLICLTRDNTDKAWVLFEAGALSKNLERSRVCTILFNLEATDLKGPLTLFQATRFNRADVKKMVETINNAADDKLEALVLDGVFEKWWPDLEQEVSEILASDTGDEAEGRRSDRDILEEMLTLTRISALRSTTPPGITEGVVRDLAQGLEEVLESVALVSRPMAIRMIVSIEPPFRLLCEGAGVPEVYEQFRVIRDRRLARPEESEESRRGDLGPTG